MVSCVTSGLPYNTISLKRSRQVDLQQLESLTLLFPSLPNSIPNSLSEAVQIFLQRRFLAMRDAEQDVRFSQTKQQPLV